MDRMDTVERTKDEIITEAIESAKKELGVSYPLRPFQSHLIKRCLSQNVVVCNARTASGKSVIAILWPKILLYLNANGINCGVFERRHVLMGNLVLLVVPFKSLSRTQTSTINQDYPNLVCSVMTGAEEAASIVKLFETKGKVGNIPHLVVTTPETLAIKSVHKFFGADSTFMKKYCSLYIVDEAHNVQTDSFRVAYQNIGRQAFTSVKLLIMTGSCTYR